MLVFVVLFKWVIFDYEDNSKLRGNLKTKQIGKGCNSLSLPLADIVRFGSYVSSSVS